MVYLSYIINWSCMLQCRALHKRLTLAQKERNLTDANQEILQLKVPPIILLIVPGKYKRETPILSIRVSMFVFSEHVIY
jgi:hypothetical protein